MHFRRRAQYMTCSKKQRPKEGPIATFGYKYMELGFASPPLTPALSPPQTDRVAGSAPPHSPPSHSGSTPPLLSHWLPNEGPRQHGLPQRGAMAARATLMRGHDSVDHLDEGPQQRGPS